MNKKGKLIAKVKPQKDRGGVEAGVWGAWAGLAELLQDINKVGRETQGHLGVI